MWRGGVKLAKSPLRPSTPEASAALLPLPLLFANPQARCAVANTSRRAPDAVTDEALAAEAVSALSSLPLIATAPPR